MPISKLIPAQTKSKRSGFTLVELLVVISVIAILASLLIANLNSARSRARDAQRKADFDQIKKALRLYYNDYKYYPAHVVDSNNIYQLVGCGASGDTACAWGGYFGDIARQYYYMKTLPADPLSTQSYTYVKVSNEEFCLVTTLENEGDPAAATSQSHCALCNGTGQQYVVCPD